MTPPFYADKCMVKINTMVVQGLSISIYQSDSGEDFISLTDIIEAKDGEFFISDWMRNANTLDYLGAWESMHNPHFNYGEFATIRAAAGANSFKISVKDWVARTGAIGITARAGRYGGTYAHKDVAFHFCMWISPEFQLYVVKEFQRLKAIETNQYEKEWDVRRLVSKANYVIHTDAIKEYVIPWCEKPQGYAYASEADMLNQALFGCTAREWREANPERALKGENIRDLASINELTILSNLESLNAHLIAQGLSMEERLEVLAETAKHQKELLDKANAIKALKRLQKGSLAKAHKELDPAK